MKLLPFFALFAAAPVALWAAEIPANSPRRLAAPVSASLSAAPHSSVSRRVNSGAENTAAALPPLPPGVEDLKFSEFFKIPVGPRGLELTARVRSLDGKRVRILGFMVFEEITRCPGEGARDRKGRLLPAWLECLTPGRLMLTPTRQAVSFAHYGICDDLPPQTLFVTVPDRLGDPIPHAPGPLLLTGILSVGNKVEPDGRVSSVRLTLDPLSGSSNTAPAAPSLPDAALSSAQNLSQPNPHTNTSTR